MRRSRFVVIVALLTALVFCMETCVVSAASLKEVRKSIQSKQQELEKSKKEEKDLSDKISSMDKQISSKEADISKLESAISDAETQMDTLKKELKEAEEKAEQQDEDLNARLRNMYKNGSVGFLDVLFDSDDISEFLTNLDMVQKVYSQDNPKNGSYKWRQMFLYRLAASYLDYAEAVNEAYDNRASREDALKYVNKVRERAGVREYTLDAVAADDAKYIHVDDNQLAVREAVRMERRVELCCEGSRWSDIRRWRIVEQLPEMCGDDYGMNFAGTNSQEFYKRTVFQTRVWKRAMYWFPVYIDEMNKNTNLVQAPFWN